MGNLLLTFDLRNYSALSKIIFRYALTPNQYAYASPIHLELPNNLCTAPLPGVAYIITKVSKTQTANAYKTHLRKYCRIVGMPSVGFTRSCAPIPCRLNSTNMRWVGQSPALLVDTIQTRLDFVPMPLFTLQYSLVRSFGTRSGCSPYEVAR